MSWTEILTRLAAFLTLPSTRGSPPSSFAMSMTPFELVLYCMAEVLDMTLSRSMVDRAVMSSSVIPSAKYSFSGSELMFLNGRIAIVCLSGTSSPCFRSSAGIKDVGLDLCSNRYVFGVDRGCGLTFSAVLSLPGPSRHRPGRRPGRVERAPMSPPRRGPRGRQEGAGDEIPAAPEICRRTAGADPDPVSPGGGAPDYLIWRPE